MAKEFLEAPQAVPAESLRIRNDRLNACVTSSALDPTNATIRVDLAEALADLNRFDEAERQGRKARALDDAMPHRDRKLPASIRGRLNEQIPIWTAKKARR
jgi:hypothetical protein